MPGTLVYVGAVSGGELTSLAGKFEKVLAVQAHGEEVDRLRSQHPDIMVVHGAATLKHGSTATFYVASNFHSSSLGPLNKSWAQKHPSLSITHTIQVPTVNIAEVCRENAIGQVDLLISDVQGGDYDVVKSLEPMLKARSIKTVRCKTTRDGFVNVHDGLPSNELESLRRLFGSLGYQLSGIGWGDVKPGTFEPVNHEWWEFHTCWTPIPPSSHRTTTASKPSTTYIVGLYEPFITDGMQKFLSALDAPTVIFCDDQDHKTYLAAWRARNTTDLLDKTMFVCQRAAHLPIYSKVKTTNNNLGLLSLPHFVERATSLNPFHSTHFVLCNPTNPPTKPPTNQPTKSPTNGPSDQHHNNIQILENSAAVWGGGEQMADSFRVLGRLIPTVLDAGQIPDPLFAFSDKMVKLPTKNPCANGNNCQETKSEWTTTAKEAKTLRELGDPTAALDICRKIIESVGPQNGAARREAKEEGAFWSEVMLSAWFSGDSVLAREALDRCCDLDPETYELAGKCAHLLAIRLSSLCDPKDAVKLVEVPVGRRPNLVNGNLTIYPYGDQHYLAIARMINWINGQCIHPQRILTNENAILLLDSDFNVVREDRLVDATGRPTKHTGWTGFEDVRLYHADAYTGTLHFVSSLFDHEGGGKPQICRCMAKYVGNGRWDVVVVQPLNRLDPSGEKNWLPFKPPQNNICGYKNLDPEALWCVYHWYPRYRILDLKPDGTHATVVVDEKDRPGSFHQGSTSPIFVKELDSWLALIHISWGIFYHRFVLLDKDSLKITKIGPIMYLNQLAIEYACGMCLSHNHQNLVISFGLGDSSSHVIQIPIRTVHDLLINNH